MNGPNSTRNGITPPVAAVRRKAVVPVFVLRVLLVRAATVLRMIVLVAAVVAQWWLFHGRYPAQFPEIFPAPCVKSANSTSRFSDT